MTLITNEKLIEEAALAIAASEDSDRVIARDRRGAAAAFAVFEKALGEATVTPTDDERGALITALSEKGFSGIGEEVGTDQIVIDIEEVPEVIATLVFRRSEKPEPSNEEIATLADEQFGNQEGSPYPQGEPSDLVRRLIDLRGDMRHNADEVATLDAAITALSPQDEPSDAPEVEFPFTHEGVTLEQDDGGIWVSNGGGSSYWISPRVLDALRAASAIATETGHAVAEPTDWHDAEHHAVTEQEQN